MSNVEIIWHEIIGCHIPSDKVQSFWLTHTLICLQCATGEIAFAAERLLICKLLKDALLTQNIQRRKTRWVWITNWAPGMVWTVAKSPGPTEIGSRERPARSKSRYRLLYPGPLQVCSRLLTRLSEVDILSARILLRTFGLTWNLNGFLSHYSVLF